MESSRRLLTNFQQSPDPQVIRTHVLRSGAAPRLPRLWVVHISDRIRDAGNIVAFSNLFPVMERDVVSHAPTPAPAEQSGEMSHREILEALSGLLLAMFVAMLSSTVVSNALPRIVTDLDGSQTGYTWVVVATLLTMTATTPIWGKLADLFSKKLLVQTALVIFVIGSLIAGVRALDGGADRCPRRPGPRRRRPDRAGPGRDREHGDPA